MTAHQNHTEILGELETSLNQQVSSGLRRRLDALDRDSATTVLTTVRDRISTVLYITPDSTVNLNTQISRELDKMCDLECYNSYVEAMRAAELKPIAQRLFLADTRRVRTRWNCIVERKLQVGSVVQRVNLNDGEPFIPTQIRTIKRIIPNCTLIFVEVQGSNYDPFAYALYSEA